MILGLSDEQFSALMVLDFDPVLSCEYVHPPGAAVPEAKWRVMRAHADSVDCDWQVRLVCDGCLNRLYDLTHDRVRCVRCRQENTATEWWRLLGRI